MTTTIDGVPYSTGTTYDSAGRPSRTIYPGGFTVEMAYTAANGHPVRIVGVTEPGKIYWQAVNADADLKVTREDLGNGVIVASRTRDPLSGMLTDLTAMVGSTTVQQARYGWDSLGNLTSRADLRPTIAKLYESFEYDALNRLVKSKLCQPCSDTGSGPAVPGQTFDYSYDRIGNLRGKGSLTYDYPTAGNPLPHAMKTTSDSVGGAYNGASYLYDANGNMVSGANRSITYTAFDNVKKITRTSSETTFTYGPARETVKAMTIDPSRSETVRYVDDLYEKVERGTETIERYYIGSVAIRLVTNGVPELRYLLKDHLDSNEVVLGEDGSESERLSYDAWGRRRPSSWMTPTSISAVMYASTTDEGFTGHEHYDAVGVIHMKGRVYEPTLGRFLTPDPNVQEPYGPQNLNRYSYVINNPLSYTDPTGFFFNKLVGFWAKNWRPVLAVAVGVGIAIACYGVCSPLAYIAAGAIAGAASGGITTGTWQGAGVGALIGAATAAIGQGIANVGLPEGIAGDIGRALAHGVTDGTINEIRGGRFVSGFLASNLTSAASPVIDTHISISGNTFGTMAARTAASAIVGGTASVLGGGKFENGAASSAFSSAAMGLRLADAGGDVMLEGKPLDVDQKKKINEITVPPAPPGVSVDANILEAYDHVDDWRWFTGKVKTGGDWDYKKFSLEKYEDFGNFNYGATGRALGVSREILLRAAGLIQQQGNAWHPEYGTWAGPAPHGDQVHDQTMIRRGMDYFEQKGR